MKRSSAVLSIALASSGAALAAPAFAEDGSPRAAARVQLEYHRERSARACLSPELLMSAVETRLGRRVFAPASEAELLARVRARRRSGRFEIAIALYDREGHSLGTRELSTRARHCSSLDDSMALVLSLAADMPRAELVVRASERPAEPASARDMNAAPAPASLGTPLTIPEATPPARLGLQLEPALGVAVVSGLLPRVAYGLELGVTLRASAFWPVSLRGTGWASQRRELPGGARGARFSLQTLEVGVCPWTGLLGDSSLSVCALQWVGRGRARGFGFDQTETSDAWLLQFGPAATLTQRVGPLFVAASGAALVPAVRRRYFFTAGVTDGQDFTLHEQPWLSLSAAVRVGIEI
jgi:hypothetical protein